MNTLCAVYKKNRIMYKKNMPVSHFISRIIGTTTRMITVYFLSVYMFGSHTSKEFIVFSRTTNYVDYAAFGLILSNFSIGLLMNVSRSLISELREGTLYNLLITPFSVVGYFMGVFVEQFMRLLVESLIIIGISILFGVSYHDIDIFKIIFVIIIMVFHIGSLTILIANIMLYLRDTFISQNTFF